MSGHVVSTKLYVGVFLALLFLTGLTTGVAFIDMGKFNLVVALAIAVCKMLLVVLFFMHAKYSPSLTKLVIVAAFLWLGIMITLTLSDEATRGWGVPIQGWSVIVPYLHALLP
jgi:cytochrome c oxidase subunit IV